MRVLVGLLTLSLIAAMAHASPPDPTRCTYDKILVGNSSGHDMGNAFVVICRDMGNIPEAGWPVTIRFVTTPVRPYLQQESGVAVDCVNRFLSRITDSNGETIFHGRLGGYDNANVAEVRASGILLGHISIRSTDMDADGATDLRDLNLFRQRFLFDHSATETDFNKSGVTDGYDFNLFRAEFMSGVKGSVCP